MHSTRNTQSHFLRLPDLLKKFDLDDVIKDFWSMMTKEQKECMKKTWIQTDEDERKLPFDRLEKKN